MSRSPKPGLSVAFDNPFSSSFGGTRVEDDMPGVLLFREIELTSQFNFVIGYRYSGSALQPTTMYCVTMISCGVRCTLAFLQQPPNLRVSTIRQSSLIFRPLDAHPDGPQIRSVPPAVRLTLHFTLAIVLVSKKLRSKTDADLFAVGRV